MIIVNTQKEKAGSFEDYIQSLTIKSRQQYRAMEKRNRDLVYKRVPFNKEKIEQFMEMWQRQLIRGHPRRWGFGIEYPEKVEAQGKLRCFVAVKGPQEVSMQFVENHDGYIECHPPMWDKVEYFKSYLAKFMWFNLIKYAMGHDDMDWVDLGGCDGTWPEVIRNRKKWPWNGYKWIYVPRHVRENPKKQPNFTLEKPNGVLGDIKYLKEI